MTKATINQIDKAFQKMSDGFHAFQSKNIVMESKRFLATLDPSDEGTQRTIYITLLGTIALVLAYEGRGDISLRELETVFKPIVPSSSIAETVQLEKIRHQRLVSIVGERYLTGAYPFTYEGFSAEFDELKPILKEIDYLINPAEFTRDYETLKHEFDESISLFVRLAGGKLTPAQSQFRDSLTLLTNKVFERCLRNDPLYTLAKCQIIADSVDVLVKKVGGTKFTQNDIKIFSDKMAPFAATSEWLAVLLKTLLIAVSSMLVGMAVAGAPGMIAGASVGTVGACLYSMWAAPETLPTDMVEDSAKALFVK